MNKYDSFWQVDASFASDQHTDIPCPSVCRQILCRTITWVVFLRIFLNFISCLLVKRGGSLSFLTIFTFAVPELLDLIWWKIGFCPTYFHSQNITDCSDQKWKGPSFTGKLLIKFQNILRNATHVIIWHRVKILGVYWFHHVRPSVCRQILCRMITWVVFLRIFLNFISCLLVKRGGSLSFLIYENLYILVIKVIHH
jgi:hypothetical protein